MGINSGFKGLIAVLEYFYANLYICDECTV